MTLIALVVLTAYSLNLEQLTKQTFWTESGIHRLMIFVRGYLAWVLVLRFFRPVIYVRATAAVSLLYAVLYCGLVPVLAVSLILFAAYVAGRWVLNGQRSDDDALAVATGLAMLVFVMSLVVWLRVNYWWTYLPAILLLLAVRRRDAMAAARRVTDLVKLGENLKSGERLMAEAVGMLLVAHLLVVLKPEVSADGLGMHLVVAKQVQYFGLWDGNFEHVLWALMPMGGDWIYTVACVLGGEMAARLMNFAALLLTLGLLYAAARRVASCAVSLLVALVFASSPLVQLVTGSLFVENIQALFLMGATLAVIRLEESERERLGQVAAMLLGAALSTKFGSVAYVAPIVWLAGRRMQKGRLAAIGLLLVFALPPYAVAYAKTGNPLFPFLNNFFKSAAYVTDRPLIDDRYKAGLHFDTLWQITFQTKKYLEGYNGGFGFHYLVLLPLAILAFRRSWPFAARAALLIGGLGFVLTFKAESYVRYLYPSLPILLVAVAAAVSRMPESLRVATIGVSLAIAGLNLYFLPASGGYHEGFYLAERFVPGETARYVLAWAPGKLMVEELNRRAPGEAAAFIASNQYAGLHATAYTDVWHHHDFRTPLLVAPGALEVLRLFDRFGIRWIVAPCPGEEPTFAPAPVRELLEKYTHRVTSEGKFCLARVDPAYEGASGIELAAVRGMLPMAVEKATVDDFDPHVLYLGSWHQDRQFRQAANSTLTYSAIPGDVLWLRFRGTSVRYRHTKAANRGRAEVRIDGRVAGIVDLYSPQTRWKQEAVFDGLPPGVHDLRIRILRDKHPASSGFFVDLDAFVVN